MALLSCGWALAFVSYRSHGADAASPVALRAINLGGPALTIDGAKWEAGPVSLGRNLSQFENQSVELTPSATPGLATMIRSSLWNPEGKNYLEVKGLPPGEVSVFLYAWEDNNEEVWSVYLNGGKVADRFRSGAAGSWRRLGPWTGQTEGGKIVLTSEGGHANWSGLEVFAGSWPEHPADRSLRPASPPTAEERHFEEAIAPVLARRCVSCHNPGEMKGDLDLTTEEGAAGSIRHGKPEESEFWLQVASGDMPKKGPPLPDGEKKLLREWLAAGAKWGRHPVDAFLATTETRAGYDWWALQPVARPAVPQPSERGVVIGNEIDAFLAEKLREQGLSFSPEADRRTLGRRLSFDLTGLPPDPDRLGKWAEDRSAAAYETFVDELLASPAFGEHWARRWLDVARFSESQGFERNRIREQAWRYRDWVIGAFNQGMPYDEFVRLQLAGDQFHPDTAACLATGFLVCGTWDQVGHKEGSAAMRAVAREENMEDMVGALGQAFLGLTVQCARCHDHKFDPVSQADYYQLAAVLGGVHQEEKERENVPGVGRAHLPFLRQPEIMRVLKRGDPAQPGEVVFPRGITAIRIPGHDWGLSASAPEGERRKALALWMSDPRHPLTARVMVNRLWHSIFGQGLVDTPSDFGFNGGRPSHPALLDWLAAVFVEEGWQVKPMVKRMVMSAAYRQRSGTSQIKARESDGGNRLLWRAQLRRLTGEEIRDAMLSVSGALNPAMGGPSFRDVKVKEGNNHEFTGPSHDFGADALRRTVYRLWAYSGGHPLLDGLDCPVPGVTTPRRAATTTPLQALSLLNDPFCHFVAERFARRLEHEAPKDATERVRRAWLLAFAREPRPEESNAMAAFAAKHGWEQACLVIFNSNEFLFLK